jgi:prepilin-type N-terminal cleavage/methylation domain-containing protein
MYSSLRPASPIRRAFTLIELLIVVAIIAILAAIAVPNFLEAQTRSKVSRVQADMRSIATGLEAYRVDYSKYPIVIEAAYRTNNYQGAAQYMSFISVNQNNALITMTTLTTPIAYLTSIPGDPFIDKNKQASSTQRQTGYFFANIELAHQMMPVWNGAKNISGPIETVYLNGPNRAGKSYGMSWLLSSSGPTREGRQNGNPVSEALIFANDSRWEYFRSGEVTTYDPSNGTVSHGIIMRSNAGVH